jgi:hypothetical protein
MQGSDARQGDNDMKSFQFTAITDSGKVQIRVDNAPDIRVAVAAVKSQTGMSISHGRGMMPGFEHDVLVDAAAE